MHAAQPIFTHCKYESPFFQIREKRDHFHHPIYKTIAKIVLGTCLQSKLENTKQGKLNFVKKIGGLL